MVECKDLEAGRRGREVQLWS